MINISAFIITKNEASRVAKAINSVKDIAEEIIVVDSGSVDDTVSIAESLGAKVIFNEWPGYVKQKSFAESLCKNNWVLNIDADEELTQELQAEIKQIFNSAKFKPTIFVCTVEGSITDGTTAFRATAISFARR